MAALLATVFSITAYCDRGHAQQTATENPAPDAPAKPEKAPSTVEGKEDKAKDTPPENDPSPQQPELPPLPDEDDAFQQIKLFTQILELVRESYVDPEKTTYKRLISSALEGMLADLDPHSQFMHPKVFEQLKKNTDSTYEGVGITISFRNEVLSIVTVREDGPAARADILPGDQILKINQFLIKDIGLSEAVALLKGKPGESLKLTLRRPATKEVFEVEMVREVIKQDTVKDIGMIDSKLTAPYKIGYARILQFNQPTAEEFSVALDDLEKKGMDAFILDLRNNPGGLLNSAIAVCGEFVAPGTLVLTTEGREGLGIINPYRTPASKRRERSYPLAILVNHSSASGSEVVAGALQDLNRAIIVGETTFGKGSVQSILPTGDGTAIRMTTAKYYTPSRRTIHENGVSPNIVSALTPDEEQQLMRWWQRNSLPPEERKEVKEYHDRQLIRAVDAMKGALVYSQRKEKQDAGKKPADPKSAKQSEPAKEGEASQAKPKSEPESPVKQKPKQPSDPKKKPASEEKKGDDKAQ
jgi:carboxyl-terminal processing protease